MYFKKEKKAKKIYYNNLNQIFLKNIFILCGNIKFKNDKFKLFFEKRDFKILKFRLTD